MDINKRRLAKLSFALIAAATLPLGLAAPSQAATTKDGCTVNPLPPEFRNTFNAANVPYVYYPYEVSCVASASGSSVEVKTTTWESPHWPIRAGEGSSPHAFGRGRFRTEAELNADHRQSELPGISAFLQVDGEVFAGGERPHPAPG